MEDIEISTKNNGSVYVATADSCGRRWDMEDEHQIVLDAQVPFAPRLHYAAVFDGHGGKRAAQWCRDNLHTYLATMPDATHNSIKQAFLDADADQRVAAEAVRQYRADNSGCTAAVVAIVPVADQEKVSVWDVTTMHAGDSRVLIVSDRDVMATHDHKPERPTEKSRIVAAGGSVFAPCGRTQRLDGNLSVSRGFGDHAFKRNTELNQAEQKLTAVPDVDTYRVTSRTRVVLMCDGVFECLTNDQVADLIRDATTPEECARAVTERAFFSGSNDNISVIAIWLEAPGRSLRDNEEAPTRPATPESTSDEQINIGVTEVSGRDELALRANLHHAHPHDFPPLTIEEENELRKSDENQVIAVDTRGIATIRTEEEHQAMLAADSASDGRALALAARDNPSAENIAALREFFDGNGPCTEANIEALKVLGGAGREQAPLCGENGYRCPVYPDCQDDVVSDM
jgi:serine/threonine protein phosphatase PrpC